MSADKAFLGRGWSFPPTFKRNGAKIEMLEGEADIVSSLEILFSTRPGERVMQPEYGCNLDELMFESLDTRMKTLMADKIESAILYHEPRITVEDVQIEEHGEHDGVVLITVVYRVKSTNSRFNFVFPYYKDEGTDIGLTTRSRILPDKN